MGSNVLSKCVYDEEVCLACMLEHDAGSRCPHCGHAIKSVRPSYPDLPRGTILDGKYLVGALQERCGSNSTYIGRDLALDRRVTIREYFPSGSARDSINLCAVVPAVKMTLARFEEGLARFREQSRSLCQLKHRNVVIGLDYFEANQTAYLVTDYAPGRRASEHLSHNGYLAEVDVLGIMLRVLDGLEAVHQAGMLHRNIKPCSICIREHGEVILTDFSGSGLLRTPDDASTIGNPYQPPEHYASNRRLGPWSDIYACGATAYNLLTGVRPPSALTRPFSDTLFSAPNCYGVVTSNPTIQALEFAMALDSAARPQSARELACMLHSSLLEVKKNSNARPPIWRKLSFWMGRGVCDVDRPKR